MIAPRPLLAAALVAATAALAPSPVLAEPTEELVVGQPLVRDGLFGAPQTVSFHVPFGPDLGDGEIPDSGRWSLLSRSTGAEMRSGDLTDLRPGARSDLVEVTWATPGDLPGTRYLLRVELTADTEEHGRMQGASEPVRVVVDGEGPEVAVRRDGWSYVVRADERATGQVLVLDSLGEPVRTLPIPDVARREPATVRWDRRHEDGRQARRGRYRLELTLVDRIGNTTTVVESLWVPRR